MSPAPGRTDVFVRGGDGAMWARTQAGVTFGPWKSLGGLMTSDPDAASWGGNRIDAFVRGLDGALWHRWTADGTNWSHGKSLGGSITSGPTAVSWGTNRIDVFARGVDNAVVGQDLHTERMVGLVCVGRRAHRRSGCVVVGARPAGRLRPRSRRRPVASRLHGCGLVTVAAARRKLDVRARLRRRGAPTASTCSRAAPMGRRGGPRGTGSAWVPWYPLGGLAASDPDVGSPGVEQAERRQPAARTARSGRTP